MPASTTTKAKSYRLFKIAAELNMGRDSIVEFLGTKGFDVPNKATTNLTQEMYDLVMNKFEKEHRQIEKQRRKVDAYHERRVRTGKADEGELGAPAPVTEAPPAAAAPVAAAPIVAETTPEPVEVAPVVAEEPPVVEEPSAPVVAEEPVVAEKPKKAKAAPSTPVVAEKPPVVEAPPSAPVEAVDATAEAIVETPAASTEAAPVAAEATADATADESIAEAAPAVEEKGGDANIKRPQLKGLSVVGKIAIANPKDAESGQKKRKRIRESKSVDITTEPGSSAPKKEARDGSKPATTGTKPTTTTSSTSAAAAAGDKRKRKRKGVNVSQEDVQKKIRETFSRMDDRAGSARQKRSRQKRSDLRDQRDYEELERQELENVIHVAEYVTVAELANLMDVDVSEVIAKCIGLGLMVSINQRLEKDTIQLVADEFDFTVEFQEEYAEDVLAEDEDDPETLKPRAPIVTIMGHVDHGKTSLLDYIRRANVVAGEAGGITQHIGAYGVELEDGRHIAFLDTPGHEAFTAMRARGAQVTDIVVLIVAADDSVMPQTIEAISHAQAAGVPMIVAINKVDKPDANPERIKQQLADRNVLVEAWGGKVQAVEISAKHGQNVDKLLESILLEAEILDLKANPERNARGTIIEAEIDKGRGIVATVLVQKGTLKIGDAFVAGQYSGRVRAMVDERGHRVEEAGPSQPVQVFGFDGVPTAGDTFVCLDTEQEAREIATKRQQLRREQEFKQTRRRFTLDDISKQIAQGEARDLPLIIKGDVDGSVEALADSLLRLSTTEVQVVVVMKGVGEITESDVLLAAASGAIIIGFHVRPNLKARKLAEAEGVDIRTYRVIYETVDEIRSALEGLLAPEQKEEITATVEVREVFKVSRVGSIAGCFVTDGKITRNDRVRLLRDGFEVYNGRIGSLKRHKDDVREVEQGFECGVVLENMNDVKVGDVLEAYKTIEIKRTLDDQPIGSGSSASTADVG